MPDLAGSVKRKRRRSKQEKWIHIRVSELGLSDAENGSRHRYSYSHPFMSEFDALYFASIQELPPNKEASLLRHGIEARFCSPFLALSSTSMNTL